MTTVAGPVQASLWEIYSSVCFVGLREGLGVPDLRGDSQLL